MSDPIETALADAGLNGTDAALSEFARDIAMSPNVDVPIESFKKNWLAVRDAAVRAAAIAETEARYRGLVEAARELAVAAVDAASRVEAAHECASVECPCVVQAVARRVIELDAALRAIEGDARV